MHNFHLHFIVCHLQLEDGHSLFDYDVGLNDTVQLMVRPVATLPSPLPISSPAAGAD